MDIKYYGHSCFRIRGREGTIVTDPFQPTIGYEPIHISADICTISHDHPGHNNAGVFSNNPYIITGPGEYEVGGVFITGVPSYHDRKKGAERGRNTIYTFAVDGIVLGHLGDLGHTPDQATVEMIGDIDVLLIPVGGSVTLTSSMASDVINLLEPRIVIPMHYRIAAYTGSAHLDRVSKFLKEMGTQDGTSGDTLRVSPSTLPDETQVVILEA